MYRTHPCICLPFWSSGNMSIDLTFIWSIWDGQILNQTWSADLVLTCLDLLNQGLDGLRFLRQHFAEKIDAGTQGGSWEFVFGDFFWSECKGSWNVVLQIYCLFWRTGPSFCLSQHVSSAFFLWSSILHLADRLTFKSKESADLDSVIDFWFRVFAKLGSWISESRTFWHEDAGPNPNKRITFASK